MGSLAAKVSARSLLGGSGGAAASLCQCGWRGRPSSTVSREQLGTEGCIEDGKEPGGFCVDGRRDCSPKPPVRVSPPGIKTESLGFGFMNSFFYL